MDFRASQTLLASVRTLKGVGDVVAERLNKLCRGNKLVNLLYHMPVDIIDRRHIQRPHEIQKGTIGTVEVCAISYDAPQRFSRAPFRVTCSAQGQTIIVAFFNMKAVYVERMMPIGQPRIVSGRADLFGGKLQFANPDYVVPLSKKSSVLRLQTVYPLTKGISSRFLTKYVDQALQSIPDMPEWLDNENMNKHGFESWKNALKAIHNPKQISDISLEGKHRKRLAYDELLAYQLALAISRRHQMREEGVSIVGTGSHQQKLLSILPFELTGDQQKALEEVRNDMQSTTRMMRLLQGDVGCGKTVVSLLAMLIVAENDKQSAFMAPTEILAYQQYLWTKEVLEQAGILDLLQPVFLAGSVKRAKRAEILANIERGKSLLIFGTHALFQEDVIFNNLGFVTIDEQHRFGVEQRETLQSKGNMPDLLLMSATPIPRTLTMTIYGDMDISIIREKPPGRKEIDTRVMPLAKVDELAEGIKRLIEQGERAYWVCPLIEQKDEEDEPPEKPLATIEARLKYLDAHFPGDIAVVHGRMKAAEKEENLQAFKRGDIKILLATTVIEVGVNVPEATTMVIEQAERFGLSQLHQLRGRVGRGEQQSRCILLYDYAHSETAKKRLATMRDTNDGFEIAEQDLLLRGAGDVLGTRQSGLPDFKAAMLPEHNDLLLEARREMQHILEKDPSLSSKRGKAMQQLLYLFEYHAILRYL